jgi:tryptophan synthase alpha chain
VVGSALVEICGAYGAEAPAKLRELTSALAQAVHTARQD